VRTKHRWAEAAATTEGAEGVRTVAVFPMSLLLVGVVAVVAAAWGGIVPYVGPTFGFGATGVGSWTWNEAHTTVALLPAAAGLLAGVLIVTAAGRPIGAGSRAALGLAALLGVLSGAWFVIGPTAWEAVSGPTYFTSATPLRHLADVIGYAAGPGLLLVACGGAALGEVLGWRRRAVETMAVSQPPPAPAPPAPAVEPGPAPVPAEPRHDRSTVSAN
jgi:hypothetical protein